MALAYSFAPAYAGLRKATVEVKESSGKPAAPSAGANSPSSDKRRGSSGSVSNTDGPAIDKGAAQNNNSILSGDATQSSQPVESKANGLKSCQVKSAGRDKPHHLHARVNVVKPVENETASQIEKNLQAAGALLRQGNFSEAGNIYHQTVNLAPNNASALVGYGTALLKQVKVGGALEQFDKALKLEPANAAAHCGKASVFLTKAKYSPESAAEAKRIYLADVEKESKLALDEDKNCAEAHFDLAEAYRYQGQAERATTELIQAVHINPLYTEALCALGDLALKDNHLTEATDYFQKAVASNAQSPTAHYGLGRALLADSHFARAAEELERACALYPNSWHVHHDLAYAYDQSGDWSKAAVEIKQVIRLKPDDPESRCRLAQVREAAGNLEESIDELKAAAQQLPASAEIRLTLAWQNLASGRAEDALQNYQAVLERWPTNLEAARGIVRSYHVSWLNQSIASPLAKADWKKADAALERAALSLPENNQLKYARLELKSLAGGEVDWQSVELPRTDEERLAYAEALLAQNRYKGANEQYQAVLGLANTSKQVFKLADVALLLRALDAAYAGYSKAESLPNCAGRAKRGMEAVSKHKETAVAATAEADSLARKKDFGKAINSYRTAVQENPAEPEPRVALARCLERLRLPQAAALKEAACQYKAYLSMDTQLPVRDRQRYLRHIQELEMRALKMEKINKTSTTSLAPANHANGRGSFHPQYH